MKVLPKSRDSGLIPRRCQELVQFMQQLEWVLEQQAVEGKIFFSDESHCTLGGYVNKQNCRIWSSITSRKSHCLVWSESVI